MSIKFDILAKGYFPKELPPGFTTADYANLAVKRKSPLRPRGGKNTSWPAQHNLARVGSLRRSLSIPNPEPFLELAGILAKDLKRALAKAAAGGVSSSRPKYDPAAIRAFLPNAGYRGLLSRKLSIRSGCRYLLQADVANCYSSIYTHAIGWALDKRMRLQTYWNKGERIAKKIDAAVTRAQNKQTRGVPIGPDTSYLLVEVVLAQIDKSLAAELGAQNIARWYDDYEIGFKTREAAEQGLALLQKLLAEFELQLNPGKTKILSLPNEITPAWHTSLQTISISKQFSRQRNDLYALFSEAFRLREVYPQEAVLNYAIGRIYSIKNPAANIDVIQDLVCQCMLAEPNTMPKAVALFSFYKTGGFSLNIDLIRQTICAVIAAHLNHEHGSEIAWALRACLELDISLPDECSTSLDEISDNVVALLALHMKSNGLISNPIVFPRWKALLRKASLVDENWLLAYEAPMHGWLVKKVPKYVKTHPFFKELASAGVHFYNKDEAHYASVFHPSGAPVPVQRTLKTLLAAREAAAQDQFAQPSLDIEVVEAPVAPTQFTTDWDAFIEAILRQGGLESLNAPVQFQSPYTQLAAPPQDEVQDLEPQLPIALDSAEGEAEEP